MADPEINLLCSYFVVRVTLNQRSVMLNLVQHQFYRPVEFKAGSISVLFIFKTFRNKKSLPIFEKDCMSFSLIPRK